MSNVTTGQAQTAIRQNYVRQLVDFWSGNGTTDDQLRAIVANPQASKGFTADEVLAAANQLLAQRATLARTVTASTAAPQMQAQTAPELPYAYQLALLYARAGIQVFPFRFEWDERKSNWKKIPMVTGGHHSATTDLVKLEGWLPLFAEQGVGVGIPMSATGHFALDGDLHGHGDGNALLAKVQAEHSISTGAGSVGTRTGSGGTHHLLRVSEPQPDRLGKPKDWPVGVLDLVYNGWAVAPGSVAPNGNTWLPIIDGNVPQSREQLIACVTEWARRVAGGHVPAAAPALVKLLLDNAVPETETGKDACGLPDERTDVENAALVRWGGCKFLRLIDTLKNKKGVGAGRSQAALAGCSDVAPLAWAGIVQESYVRQQVNLAQPGLEDEDNCVDNGLRKGNTKARMALAALRGDINAIAKVFADDRKAFDALFEHTTKPQVVASDDGSTSEANAAADAEVIALVKSMMPGGKADFEAYAQAASDVWLTPEAARAGVAMRCETNPQYKGVDYLAEAAKRFRILTRSGIVDVESIVDRARDVAVVNDWPSKENDFAADCMRKALMSGGIPDDDELLTQVRQRRDAASRDSAGAVVSGAYVIAGPDKDGWPDPEPISVAAEPVMAADLTMLPPSIRQAAADAAHWTRTQADFAIASFAGTCAAMLGNKIVVRPDPRNPKWTENASTLWPLLIADAGSKKTPLLNEAEAPVVELQREAISDNETAKTAYDAAVENHDDMISGMRAVFRKQAGTTGKDTDFSAVNEARKNAPKKSPETHYRMGYQSGVEAAKTFRDNTTGMLVSPGEIPPWIDQLLDSSDRMLLGLYLDAWGGGTPFQYSSGAQGKVFVDPLCANVLGGAQPGPLTELINSTAAGERHANGFMQRFLLAVWPDRKVLPRPSTPRTPGADKRYRDTVRALARFNSTLEGANFDGKRFYLDLSEDARKAFEDWEDAFGAQLVEETGAVASHFSKYSSLVGPWALLYHVIEWVNRPGGTATTADVPNPTPTVGAGGIVQFAPPTSLAPPSAGTVQRIPAVSLEAMQAGIKAAAYFGSHAKRIYAMSTADIVATRALAKKIMEGEELDGKTLRYIYRVKKWPGLRTAADVAEAVENLRDASWLRFKKVDGTTRGRPSVVLQINPKRGRMQMEEHPGANATKAADK